MEVSDDFVVQQQLTTEGEGNQNANSAQTTHEDDDPRASSEVDVTTVSSNDIPPTDVDTHPCLGNAGEEFLGSSLSGRSIYAPPRTSTNRRDSDKDIVDELTDCIESMPTTNAANGRAENVDCDDNDDDDPNNNHNNSGDEEEAMRTSASTTSSNDGNNNNNVPEWKKKIIERKREEMREKEREREKWESIPEWRRKLLESKSSRDQQQCNYDRSTRGSPSSSSPPPPAIEGDGAVSGARFWGVTLKKTPGKAEEPKDADAEADGADAEESAAVVHEGEEDGVSGVEEDGKEDA